MKKPPILLLAAALTVGVIAAPSAVAGKKKKTRTVTFEESGTITAPSSVYGAQVFGGLTTMEFIFANECSSPPTTQGFDAHIVELPMDFRLGTGRLEVIGDDTSGAYDMDVYFYDAGCGLVDPYMTDGKNPSGAIPAGATYAAIELFIGANATFDLKATATVTP